MCLTGEDGACVHTNACFVEDVEDAGLRSLAAPPGLQLHQQLGFIHDVHDLPQSLVPQSLHDGGEQHLAGSKVKHTDADIRHG